MTPYPSIRLEIIRKGIEDYEYLAILKEQVKRVFVINSAKYQNLFEQAGQLTKIPVNISKSMTQFTKDPKVLQNWLALAV